jgi:DNA-binding NtrC family response regulator
VHQSNQNRYICVVDDEADLAYLFKEALNTIGGVEVFAFTDPMRAIEHFKINHKNYRCVITDYRMPSMNGGQLLDKIKTVNPDVKGILMSAFEIHDDIFKECRSIDKFMSKPIKMSELIETVQQNMNEVEIKQKTT